MVVAALIGVLAGALWPHIARPVSRALIGWNVAVWLYLVLMWTTMLRADHHRLRKFALVHAEGAWAVLTAVSAAAVASIVAIIGELAAAKARAAGGGGHEFAPMAFALMTIAASWLLLPTLFAIDYASLYYREEGAPGSGLQFPSTDKTTAPDYWDFMYFSVTIAVASQTADVAITSPTMRRLVLAQSLLSFLFNTTILALTINVAASFF